MNLQALRDQQRAFYVDFEVAMGAGTGYYRQIERYQGANREHFEFFRRLYQRNHFLNVEPRDTPRIPKTVHQIWIGPRPFPENLKAYQQSWRRQNPEWEYKLWTNADLKCYPFAHPLLGELFHRPLTLGERVDVLRYDILYQHGGLYADCDCICLKPFDVFVHNYDFVAGIFPPMFAHMDRAVFLQNCLILARPRHPAVESLARHMHGNWDKVDFPEDEWYVTIQRTFFAVTDGLLEAAGKDGAIDIAMPPSYFFPINPYPAFDKIIRGPLGVVRGWFDERFAPYSKVKPHSFANHDSAREWVGDLWSTMTFNHPGWTLFNLKDWSNLIVAKLFRRKAQRQVARQTLDAFLARSGAGNSY